MPANYKQWTDFLIGLGIDKVDHTERPILAISSMSIA